MLRDPMSPLAVRWRDVPRIAPWLVRFALASRASRVEAISMSIHELMFRAIEAYRPMIAGTAAENLVHPGGLLHVYRGADAFAADQFSIGLRSRRGTDFELLDRVAIDARHPGLAGRFEHAVYLPRAHYTDDPQAFVRSLTDTFVAEGGQVHTAAATGFELHGNRVHAVATSSGRIGAGEVVISAGAWSRQLLRKLGTSVPLGTERGYGVDLPNPGLSLDLSVIVSDFHVALTPHRTGIRIVGLDELATVSAPARLELTERIVRGAKEAFPELRTDGGTRWMRCRPSMPDSLPVIGRAPRQDNVYLAFGHGHKGLCLGAVT
jgi:D-amino-acid dehydrogenase